jgi:hypothetical protein
MITWSGNRIRWFGKFLSQSVGAIGAVLDTPVEGRRNGPTDSTQVAPAPRAPDAETADHVANKRDRETNRQEHEKAPPDQAPDERGGQTQTDPEEDGTVHQPHPAVEFLAASHPSPRVPKL